jgi:hypothetical protein
MNNSEHIEQEIAKTLSSLEGTEQAMPKPFFYARLRARMERELLEPKRVFWWDIKPVYAYSLVVVLVLLNLMTLVRTEKIETSDKDAYSFYQSADF